MSVKQYYHQAIYDIMKSHGIPRMKRHYELPIDSDFAHVVQYTEYHVGYRTREGEYGTHKVNRHYRYETYRPVLNRVSMPKRRQAHVDIGCGAGVFSWAFLDWATSRGIGYNRVDLYGMDRCQAMIDLAREMEDKLAQRISNYPDSHYSHDADILMRQLTTHHRKDTDYTITFGHVLVQSHSPEDIQTFTRIISHIIELMDQQSKCVLVAVDATGQSGAFTVALDLLRADLEKAGIQLGNTINAGASARLIQLYPSQR